MAAERATRGGGGTGGSASAAAKDVILRVESLGVSWPGRARPVLDDVQLTVGTGECVGLAGPSGSGKSTLALALMRLLPARAVVSAGARVTLAGEDLLALDEREMVTRRGRRIGLVLQEPLLALHPAIRVGDLITEGMRAHRICVAVEAPERAAELLARVGVPDARGALRRYAHEFSGGMRQRILLASALALEPDVLIVDEPTTALDMTIQAQVLDVLDAVRAERGTALLHISHDLAVLGERADRIVRLEGGKLVHVTRAMSAAPSLAAAALALAETKDSASAVATSADSTNLLDVGALTVRYPLESNRGAKRVVSAVNSVSFTIARGESIGLVGESGCGKSSVAHALSRLVDAEGNVWFNGGDLLGLGGEPLRQMRRQLQLVSQDAGASLTPYVDVETLIAEGPVAHGLSNWEDARSAARGLLTMLKLPADAAGALPVELSSGQRQRVAIARALALRPALLVCDEPVSALDPEARASVLDALEVMRRQNTMSLLVITHDLSSVMRITSRVCVMYAGRIVEEGPTGVILSDPRMPYTRALLDAVPTGDPTRKGTRIALAGEPPSPLESARGCAFFPRCPHPSRDEVCTHEVPPLAAHGVRHVACVKQ